MASAEFFKNIIAKIHRIFFDYAKKEEAVDTQVKHIVTEAEKKSSAKKIAALKKNISNL